MARLHSDVLLQRGADTAADNTFEIPGRGKATLHSDGSVTAENDAARFSTGEDGTARVTMDIPIKNVGLENMIDVVSYSIRRDETAQASTSFSATDRMQGSALRQPTAFWNCKAATVGKDGTIIQRVPPAPDA